MKITPNVHPFDLKDVRLLDGPFRHAMELDGRYLLRLDEDVLLREFREVAGLIASAQSPAGALGGFHGHFTGHYLSACAMMYAGTGDDRFKDRGDRIVAELARCQARIGTGYVSAFSEEAIDRLMDCKPAPVLWYALHKVYAGLLDMHVHCGSALALEVCRKACDWVQTRCDRLDDSQMERMLFTEHGGMNAVLADLCMITGEEKYARLSERFNHHMLFDPLARGEDRLTGLHANTQIPKVVGAVRQYLVTGNEALLTLARYFWDVVVKERSYVIGGNSNAEAFPPKEEFSRHIGPSTCETCNTYNMLKLTAELLCVEPKAQYADFYERALYNHILASQNPRTGGMCYHVPLGSGTAKAYSKDDSFWCCCGTGIENHAKYGQAIYHHDGGRTLYVNLFIASELNWRAKGVRVRQETRYPQADSTRLVFSCENPVDLAVMIRHSHWARKGVRVSVSGREMDVQSKPASYVAVARTFQDGDVIEMAAPMTLRLEGFNDNPRRAAFMYGPVVLSAEVDPSKPLPDIVAEPDEALKAIQPAPVSGLAFEIPPAIIAGPAKDDARFTLIPFYRMHDRPYIVYWDFMTAQERRRKEERIEADRARQADLDARTTDVFQASAAEELAHNQQGPHSAAGGFNGRFHRHAPDGWFSYEMKVQPDRPIELICTYWGSEVNDSRFDILIDGVKVATQRLQPDHPGVFYNVVYPLPEDLTRGKDKVTVRFQSLPGYWTGGIFGYRMARKK